MKVTFTSGYEGGHFFQIHRKLPVISILHCSGQKAKLVGYCNGADHNKDSSTIAKAVVKKNKARSSVSYLILID